MNTPSWSMIVAYVVWQVPQLAILIGCIYYLVKTMRPEGYMLVCAQIGRMLGALIVPLTVWLGLTPTGSGRAYMASQMIGLFFSVVFAVGFAWLVVEAVKRLQKETQP
jgi:hypothetical protein